MAEHRFVISFTAGEIITLLALLCDNPHSPEEIMNRLQARQIHIDRIKFSTDAGNSIKKLRAHIISQELGMALHDPS